MTDFFFQLQNQTVKTDEDLIAEAVVAVVPEVDLEMTEILEETETGQAEVGIIETKTKVVKEAPYSHVIDLIAENQNKTNLCHSVI